MKVSICIATCQRPEGLSRLLDGIHKLEFNKSDTPEIEIIVIENSENDLCRKLCEEHPVNQISLVKYDLEKRRGISYTRNKSVQEVSSDVDFIAFIDDDEVPVSEWLDELITIQQQYDADVVHGTVKPYFTSDVPDWITKGEFFQRPSLVNGEKITTAGAGNVLVRYSILEKMNPVFDESFALTGGEDQHLFRRICASGFRMVKASDAVAYEWVPSSRLTMKWILQRAFRGGSTFSICERQISDSILLYVQILLKASIRLLMGCIFVVCSIALGKLFLVKGLSFICRSFGVYAGFFGKSYEEYRFVH